MVISFALPCRIWQHWATNIDSTLESSHFINNAFTYLQLQLMNSNVGYTAIPSEHSIQNIVSETFFPTDTSTPKHQILHINIKY